MARQNIVMLKGSAIKVDIRQKKDGQMEAVLVMGAIRGFRNVGDGREKVKIDQPIIITRNPELVAEIATWHRNDIVEIKGVVSTRIVLKSHVCPNCQTKDTQEGLLVYVEPIYAEKLITLENTEECIKHLEKVREISNMAYIVGNLTRDPKKVKVKNGPTVTQYPIAINRKFNIRQDPASTKADFPWVKSYGQNAENDRDRLKIGSLVLVDGFLQSRSINRKCICSRCGTKYEWMDRALEIVPYETEYLANIYTEEEAEQNRLRRREQRMHDLGLDKFMMNRPENKDIDYDSDVITSEDRDAGIDDFGEDDE